MRPRTSTVPSIEQLTAVPKRGGMCSLRGVFKGPPTCCRRSTCCSGRWDRRGVLPYSGRVGGPDLLAGQVILLRFADVVPMEVAISGHNLDSSMTIWAIQDRLGAGTWRHGKFIDRSSLPVVADIGPGGGNRPRSDSRAGGQLFADLFRAPLVVTVPPRRRVASGEASRFPRPGRGNSASAGP